MPDLPPELWTIIAKLLKRDPPPAGQPSNWDTHLHQQDLVSLQRVDKVSPSQTELGTQVPVALQYPGQECS
jgi:hypothetical protein